MPDSTKHSVLSHAAPGAERRSVGYFSMEIALEDAMPTYSGGLGVLAGDTIRSAADLGVPMVAVSLLYRNGYFVQRLDENGNQTEEPARWAVEEVLKEEPARVSVQIEERSVMVRAWTYEVVGSGGHVVPVYFLDADLQENTDWDRALTHTLYGGEEYHRLCQEIILGIGGVRMLEALGYEIDRYHMNEGHAALLTLELLGEAASRAGRSEAGPEDIEAVRSRCVFTTHTPVPAGHDQFPMDLAHRVLGGPAGLAHWVTSALQHEGRLNMTYLALNLSRYVNGVARKHGEVSRQMFAGYTIDAITNGVHAATWTAEPFQALFDRHIPGWRQDNFSLRSALGIPDGEVWEAHAASKQHLLDDIQQVTGQALDPEVLTLGFARRMTPYKRAGLLFEDLDRLRYLAREAGALQVVYAGKAHPRDEAGKDLIRHIFQARNALASDVPVVYLSGYDTALARRLTAGVDVWLNTPLPPNEASGTSGMKAALNGVPSLSVLDGWWIEGCLEGTTGWPIGEHPAERRSGPATSAGSPPDDAAALYDRLEQEVLPMFYGGRDRFVHIMRHAIALNGSFFNTQRMLQQYVLKAYL